MFVVMDDHYKKWKNILLSSLEQIQKRVHSGLRANADALQYVECLILRLLSNLIHNPLNSVADVEERVRRLFPYPLDKWAIAKANETLVLLKTHKKQIKSLSPDQLPIRMPVERIHQLLQKDVFGHKIDVQITQYLVAILEYIAADIFQLAGHYVKNIRHEEIYCQDIKVAMCADKVLMDMFYPDEDVSLNSNVSEDLCEQKRRTSVTYDEVVKDLIHEEKQFIRDLNLIIKVFRDPFVKILPQKELEKIFFNIDDIYDFSVNFLGSIEDALEVAEDSCPTAVGSCFEELAECAEFDVYEKYAQDIMSNSCRDRLHQCLSDPIVASTLSTTGHGMILALKYVLPKLLIGPVYHCLSYFKYIELFKDLTTSDEDKESFEQAEGLLAPLKNGLERVCKRNARPGEGYLRLYGRINRAAALTKMSELQRSIDGWEGKDIGQFCNEFVMDGPLGKLSGTSARSGRITERHVFLFDGLMVLCKPNNKRSSMTVAVTGGGGGAQCEWRLKEKYLIRNIEIIDREDYNETDVSPNNGYHNNNNNSSAGNGQGQHNNVPKYAFEIVPRNQTRIILFAKSPEEKALWMSNLILLNTRSMLERTLDSMLTDEAKKHPLRLPSPDVYRFAVEDSDSNIIFEESKSNTNVPLIKGATLLKLVERLTYHMYADPMFVRTFLTTYRSFCTPQTLLDLLIERFEIPEPEFTSSLCSSQQNSILSLNNSINNNYFFGNNNNNNNNNDIQYNNSSLCCYNNSMDGQSYGLVGAGGQQIYENTEIRNNYREILKRFRKEYSQPVQFRVLNVLRHWIDNHYYDFERDSHLLDTLKKFLDEKVRAKKNMRKWCENIKKVLERKAELCCGELPQITHSFEKNPPHIEWWLTKDPEKFDLLTLHPIELARQLTLLEFDLYRAVKPSELVGTEGQFGVWTKKDKQKTSPNLLKMIHHTSNFTFWLEKCIVESENFEERVAIMSRIIEIMIVLQDLNNFNGVLEVISAMGSACVHRLEHTMSYIERNSKLKRALDDAQELSVDHFKRYHEKLRSINPPCVPFFGMYLTNILHIEEGNPDCLVSSHQSLNHYDSQSTLTSMSSTMSSAQTTNTSLLSLSSSNMSCASTATVHSSPPHSSGSSTTGSVSSMASTSVPNTPNASTSQVLINFSKRRKVAEITGEIQQYQNQPYCLTVMPEIRHFLESLNPLGDLDEKELNDYLYSRSLEIEPRGCKQLNKFPRRWPELSLKSPGIKPRGSRGHHLPALQSLDSLLNSLSNSQIEESVDDSQTHSPSTPQTPPYSANSYGGGSDHSVFAPVFIGGGSTYSGPSPTTPIHSTPPTPSAWASMSCGLPPNPSTPPPLPPRSMRPRNSTSMSSDLSSPRSRFAPTFIPMPNSYEDQSPPPLPPRCQTFSTLPRNSSHSGVHPLGGHHIIQRLNSEITLPRRNSALDLPIAQPLLPRRFSQSSHNHGGPMSPPPPPPNSTTVFLPPVIGPCPQLPPKTYRQTLNNIART